VRFGPECGLGPNHFSRPQNAHVHVMPYPMLTSGHPTIVPLHSNPKEGSANEQELTSTTSTPNPTVTGGPPTVIPSFFNPNEDPVNEAGNGS
jgi:hypothetical protein